MNTTTRLLTARILTCAAFCASAVVEAAIFVKIPNIPGSHMGPDGKADWFVADSFSFGVEREMKESGEKGGTQDINIGVGELQECTISKSMDTASMQLAQFAINGNSPGMGEVCFSNQSSEEGKPVCYLKYKLDRVFIKSWSTSGDADNRPTEEVAFYFTKLAAGQSVDTCDGNIEFDIMSWDRWRRTNWEEGLRDILDNLGGTPPPSGPSPCDNR